MNNGCGWRRFACVSLLWGVAITALLAGPVPLLAEWAGIWPQDFVHASWRSTADSRISEIGHESAWWVERWSFFYPGEWVFTSGNKLDSPPAPPHWVIPNFATHDDRTDIESFGTVAGGWPLRAMSYLSWYGEFYPPNVPMSKSTRLDVDGIEFGWCVATATARRGALVLPLRPIWPGLVADVAFWSFAVFFGRLGVRWLRARRRRRRGLCEVCAYPRTGLPPDRACPECGTQP